MSIQQVSNNRPSGSTALSCDAGIPIVGRTSSTGTYQILKVNADGSLAIGGAASALVPYSLTPTAYPLAPVAAKGVGIIVYYDQVTSAALTAGLYTINPTYQVDTLTVGGAVNFMLIKAGTPLDAYTSTRNVGVDGFTPAATDFQSGCGLFWHNNPLQIISSTNIQGTSNLNTTAKNVYLEAGIYKLLVYVHTAFTNASSTSYIGFTEFTQIG